MSRTILNPSLGMSTMKHEFAACGMSGFSSVRATSNANWAPRAPEMNHLWPLITHSSPSWYACVRISVGSLPATSGSVMAKHERAVPSQSGRRYFSFCSGVAQCRRVCWLPSSGAWAFRTNGPMLTLAASADTAAMAVGPRPMPPHSGGMWGSQSFASLRALARSSTMAFTTCFRSSWSVASHRGRTSSSMNERTRSRTSSTSGGKVKSIMRPP